jgi:hypothetical protein
MLRSSTDHGGLGYNGKFDDEASSNRLVFFYANRSMMLFDDPAYNGQTEASSALPSGEVR